MAMDVRAPWGERIKVPTQARAIYDVLSRGVLHNLSRRPIPNPYTHEIAYRREPWVIRGRKRRDYYQPWWEVLEQRHGDCEDFAMWVVAWYRQQGDTTADIALIEWPSGGWHAVVWHPGEMPADDHFRTVADLRASSPGARVFSAGRWQNSGWLEDPSRRLGMYDPSLETPYSPYARGLQREPRDEIISGDPYVPFELAGVPLALEDILPPTDEEALTWAGLL